MQSTSSNAIEQAISFLTTPLSRTTVAASSITILQAHLYGSLTQLSQTSSSRSYKICLRLASSTPPPDCIARACEASGVNWSEWLFLIGGGMGLDLDVNITPSAVTASFCRAGTPSLGLVTVWQREEPELSTRELLYADDDSEDLFKEINRSQHSPSWLSSWSVSVAPSSVSALTAPVAVPKMQPVPLTARSHSRSSSYASSTSSSSHHSHHAGSSPYNSHANQFGNYSMGHQGDNYSSSGSNASGSPHNSVYSLSEDGSSGSSGGNMGWTRRGTVVPGPQQSAIMAARSAHAQAQAFPPVPAIAIDHAHAQGHHRSSPSISSTTSGSSNGKHRRQRSNVGIPVVVDSAKATVTAYDGGKTKVMTGGVMLGSVSSGKKRGH